MRNRGRIHRLRRKNVCAEKGSLLGAHFGEIKACSIWFRYSIFSGSVFRIDSRYRRRFYALCGFRYGFSCIFFC